MLPVISKIPPNSRFTSLPTAPRLLSALTLTVAPSRTDSPNPLQVFAPARTRVPPDGAPFPGSTLSAPALTAELRIPVSVSVVPLSGVT